MANAGKVLISEVYSRRTLWRDGNVNFKRKNVTMYVKAGVRYFSSLCPLTSCFCTLTQRFQASAEMLDKSAVLWGITPPRALIAYRRFGHIFTGRVRVGKKASLQHVFPPVLAVCILGSRSSFTLFVSTPLSPWFYCIGCHHFIRIATPP